MSMKIKIATIHNDNIDVASVRLRSIYLFDYINNKNIKIYRNINFIKLFSCKIIHFHMRYKPSDILKVIILRFFKKKIIFDIDDIPINFLYNFFFILMINFSSKVTCDNYTRRDYLKNFSLVKSKFIVIRDVIDINPLEYNKIYIRKFHHNNSFFWTGHQDNYHSIERFVKLLEGKKNYNINIVTNINFLIKKINLDNVIYTQWKKDLLFKTNINCDYAILNHSLSKIDRLKSENKMVLAIAAGMIPIVSNTPSYVNLSKKLNCEKLIFNDFEEIFNIVESLDNQWKEEFILRAQKFILKEYTNQVIFKKFIEIVN